MHRVKPETVAAIDVGSNALRMTIAQISPKGGAITLEDVWKSTNIGRDTFAYGRVQIESLHHTCDTLKGFHNLMQDYKVKNYRAVATSGIREAENRQYVLEQIRLRTGLVTEVINNAQERFLMYKAVREHFSDFKKKQEEGAMVLNIGAGGVEISAYKEGILNLTEYIKVGTLRLREILADLERLTLDFPSLMEEFIESRINFLEPKIRQLGIRHFVGLGGELAIISGLCTSEIPGANERSIDKQDLSKLYAKVHSMTTEQIILDFRLPRNQAEILLPSIILFYRFLKMTKADGINTPMVSLRNGLLADMADEYFNTKGRVESLEDVIHSAWYIGRKYFVEDVHSKYIEWLAMSIFDQTSRIHRMGERERFYLRVASILHDVGKHVNLNQHDIHSYGIIRFQDLMGFSNRELDLIANVARYHSGEIPNLSHENYYVLDERDRITVSKLSAILRLAEALDISHKQKIKGIELGISGKELHFRLKSVQDTLLEESNFSNNAVFFEEVMGTKPIIKRRS